MSVGVPLVVAAVLAVRARLGLDLGDGTHAVALAVRLARGDQPFRDEMNLQALGSWPAVPFTWVWLHTVGLDGIVLASRLWFVGVALGVVATTVAALRPLARGSGRPLVTVAASAAVVPIAYNLPVIGYNTTPALLYLLAAASLAGAIARGGGPREGRRRPTGAGWAVLGGTAAVLGAVSHPVTAPAAATLLVVGLLVTRGRARLALLAGAAGATAVLGALLASVWGVGDLRDTLAFTAAYQGERVDRATRLTAWLGYLGGELREPPTLVALLLGMAAAVLLRLGRRTAGAALVVGLGVAAAQGLTRARASATLTVEAWLSPVMATVLLLVLLPTALLTVTTARRQHALRPPRADAPPLGPLLALGVLPALVGCLTVAAFTSSSPVWGAEGAVLAPAVLAVVLCALTGLLGLRASSRAGGTDVVAPGRPPPGSLATVAAAAVVLLALLASVVVTSFRDAPPTRLVAAAPAGAFAGLLTTERRAGEVASAQAAVRSCATPGAGVLAIGYPAAYLMGDVVARTPVTWLGDFGPSTAALVRRLDAGGVWPECVVRPATGWPARPAGAEAAADPLRARIDRDYAPVPLGTGTTGLVVLRRLAP
ncbi:MAG: hypothetical protein JWP82_2641 [Humibacillus sp.]|nr:hypothetical protein [Humibacillus sp.]